MCFASRSPQGPAVRVGMHGGYSLPGCGYVTAHASLECIASQSNPAVAAPDRNVPFGNLTDNITAVENDAPIARRNADVSGRACRWRRYRARSESAQALRAASHPVASSALRAMEM